MHSTVAALSIGVHVCFSTYAHTASEQGDPLFIHAIASLFLITSYVYLAAGAVVEVKTS